MEYRWKELVLRPIAEKDLPVLWKLKYSEELPQWKKWDAPYFEHKHLPFSEYMKIKDEIINQDSCWAIEVNGELIGTISYYWEHQPSRWMEMGIGIYNPAYWNGGWGTKALSLWITHIFHSFDIARIGYTTWSGNVRMIRLGEKLGMQLEGRMRKVRYHDGEYYDSIRMGLLREEWEVIRNCVQERIK
ncbi:GNAT family N-acetyltransferase [Peribacillus sp. SCS-37]|uniref:GNAT family N-acetyltransferase n=1 Tax=Paraperibacillus esterisolvens TaxID=3115296 RepID=UPI003906AAE3